MNNSPLAFLDSGIGGLPYLEWLKERLPQESFVYLADNLNFPYGTKSKEQLVKIMSDTMNFLYRKYNPKAAVIACNTASVISLASLREEFRFPIIGVVPAVKPAAFMSRKKRIGLMASNRTIEDSYTENLINEHASDCAVFRYAGTEIIDFIENKLCTATTEEATEIIRPAVDFFINNDVDILVLGCTHFLFLEKQLQSLLGDGISIIDSREGVGNQIIRVLGNNDLLSAEKMDDYFILTGTEKNREKIKNYNWISEKYGLCAV